MTPVDPLRCQQIATLLRRPRSVIVDYTDADPHWSGLAGSQLLGEQDAAMERGGQELASALEQAIAVSQLYVFAMAQHLDALAVLFETDRPPPYSISVLARAVIELAARVWWVTDPEVDVRVRVARGFTEKLVSADDWAPRKQRSSGRRSSPASAKGDTTTDEQDALRTEMHSLGIGAEKRPSATKLVGEFLEHETPAMARHLYRILSANTHGTLWALTMHFTPGDASAGQSNAATYEVDQGSLDGPANVAILAFCWSVERIAHLWGWPIRLVHQLLVAADRVFG
jgi:hypothetical protein